MRLPVVLPAGGPRSARPAGDRPGRAEGPNGSPVSSLTSRTTSPPTPSLSCPVRSALPNPSPSPYYSFSWVPYPRVPYGTPLSMGPILEFPSRGTPLAFRGPGEGEELTSSSGALLPIIPLTGGVTMSEVVTLACPRCGKPEEDSRSCCRGVRVGAWWWCPGCAAALLRALGRCPAELKRGG